MLLLVWFCDFVFYCCGLRGRLSAGCLEIVKYLFKGGSALRCLLDRRIEDVVEDAGIIIIIRSEWDYDNNLAAKEKKKLL